MAALDFPLRFADLKKRILKEEDKGIVIKAWAEVLEDLNNATNEFMKIGSSLIPQVDFAELKTLSQEKIDQIRKRGTVHVRNVVDEQTALRWKESLRDYAKANPSVRGYPKENPEFYMIYWAKAQLEARFHSSILATQRWLNSLFHSNGAANSPHSLVTPLSLADRFRMRRPSSKWPFLPPHIDGGSIERWEDDGFRTCFSDVLRGSWRLHDPYNIDGRLRANTDMYSRPNQCSAFRTWQGWLSMSHTGPNEGTLQVFPDIKLSNSYLILRPFFKMLDPSSSAPLDAANWVLDPETPDFPGIIREGPEGQYYSGLRLNEKSHPHLRVPEAVVSVPKVVPGDMIFWHCDMIHSAEFEHRGKNDASVMYIPAVPLTTQNANCIARQREGEGRKAMGLEPFDEVGDLADVFRMANKLIVGTS